MKSDKVKVFCACNFLVAAILVVSFMMPGHASAKSGGLLQVDGQMNVKNSQVSIIEYVQMVGDPSHLEQIKLKILDDRVDDSVRVLLSTDDGITWVSCSLFQGSTWICKFSQQNAPDVVNVETIDIVIGG